MFWVFDATVSMISESAADVCTIDRYCNMVATKSSLMVTGGHIFDGYHNR
jgi:hypothetical protein